MKDEDHWKAKKGEKKEYKVGQTKMTVYRQTDRPIGLIFIGDSHLSTMWRFTSTDPTMRDHLECTAFIEISTWFLMEKNLEMVIALIHELTNEENKTDKVQVVTLLGYNDTRLDTSPEQTYARIKRIMPRMLDLLPLPRYHLALGEGMAYEPKYRKDLDLALVQRKISPHVTPVVMWRGAMKSGVHQFGDTNLVYRAQPFTRTESTSPTYGGHFHPRVYAEALASIFKGAAGYPVKHTELDDHGVIVQPPSTVDAWIAPERAYERFKQETGLETWQQLQEAKEKTPDVRNWVSHNINSMCRLPHDHPHLAVIRQRAGERRQNRDQGSNRGRGAGRGSGHGGPRGGVQSGRRTYGGDQANLRNSATLADLQNVLATLTQPTRRGHGHRGRRN